MNAGNCPSVQISSYNQHRWLSFSGAPRIPMIVLLWHAGTSILSGWEPSGVVRSVGFFQFYLFERDTELASCRFISVVDKMVDWLLTRNLIGNCWKQGMNQWNGTSTLGELRVQSWPYAVTYTITVLQRSSDVNYGVSRSTGRWRPGHVIAREVSFCGTWHVAFCASVWAHDYVSCLLVRSQRELVISTR